MKRYTTATLMLKTKESGIEYQLRLSQVSANSSLEAKGIAFEEAKKENPEHQVERIIAAEIEVEIPRTCTCGKVIW